MPTPEHHNQNHTAAGSAGSPSEGKEPLREIDPIPVNVVFEPVSSDKRWGQGGWQLASVEPGEPDAALQIRLFRDEAQGYYLNVTTPEPSIFVMWREDEGGAQAIDVTLSYDEAGRWLDGGENVDRVPMPQEMCAWLTEYVQLHYQPETRRKRRGNKPSFMRSDEFEAMVQREKDLVAGPDSDRSSRDKRREN